MQSSRIFETVLYAEDLAAAERFYHQALGLEVIGRGELFVVFRCGGGVLLLFDPRTVPHRAETFLPTGRLARGILRSR
jgi:catechol 2,3-dioxygenase-like lactoylglutathione lyase family enzyme